VLQHPQWWSYGAASWLFLVLDSSTRDPLSHNVNMVTLCHSGPFLRQDRSILLCLADRETAGEVDTPPLSRRVCGEVSPFSMPAPFIGCDRVRLVR
jgi:hypothetical protein